MQTKSALIVLAALLIAPTAALCQGSIREQQQQACEDDAYRLCPDEIPDEARVAQCMARQKSKLSPACRAWFSSPRRR